MTVFFLSLGLITLGVLGLSLSIIVRKNGKFPEYSVGHNKKMRERGIRCPKEEERMLLKKGAHGNCCNCRKA
ncbi:MAG TPA: hypothetical protein PLM86_06510 [Bacteroidales bacterium]|nr:hypothetical protein [Bacteroidales bacterium]OQB71142.1 MAG: hypothetical protein BWX93_00373 [Bacteroidetes bacterium ADurb.Bin139]HOG25822.1 hypothetical protein [Bacteroidales bacterium]HOR11327.1 hypothetical protein [Bacteroidales bacterium]HOZ19080.1 hypothetical protein [Bacteroidales bacterium]